MKINFTKKQYETLLKMVYMANSMIDAVADESEDNEFTVMEEYIFSFAKHFGSEHYVAYDEKEKRYYPSERLEEDEEVNEYIQNYDDDTFWEKLIFNLSRRDMENKYGEATVEKMSDEECLVKEQPFAEKYEKEFGKNGLKNLTISSGKENVSYRQKR
ncbi:MAG: hypothetical protein NTX75_02585 [Proteobacteria bacterium]|nr:hypothetical protein [Pseudomonadota bacterium]